MLSYSKFSELALDRYCTDCVNQLFQINLTREDCRYHMYIQKCKNCGRMKHIVTAVKTTARGKVRKGKVPTEQTQQET